ncbi:MAG: PilC/PilY family type IV pilus protein [Deltaproteobacteria bacterium]
MKKTIKTTCLILFVLLAVSLFAGNVSATAPVAGEEALFTNSTSPDALLLLDLSGSMAWNPAGGNNTYGNTSCSGTTFYEHSTTGYTTNCSRLAIAKRSIFKILDDTGNGTIDSQDEGSLGVRMGYMRYYNCSASSEEQTGTYSYTSGCNQIPGSSSSRRYIGSKYSQIYCGSNTSCIISDTGSYSVGGASASGGTTISTALHEAYTYLFAHQTADSAADCRKKFVILITDGSDTYACGGNGDECQQHQYKRRREVVARTQALAVAGYKVFVIGFGSAMPDYLQKTLNWMAYYGGTDNPNQTNSGSVTGFIPEATGTCSADSAAMPATCYDGSSSPPSPANFKASTNDPGYADLSGYAFLATNADEVATALQTAINIIRQANYSFSQSSIQSARTEDENFVYEGSFEPIEGDPFWKGHLKKYQINTDGTVGSLLLDAGTVLQSTAAADRTIKTYKSSALTSFTTDNITPADVGITTGTDTEKNNQRNAVVGYFRGETTYNLDDWKLGDVFRSTPITVGTPSSFFDDGRDSNNRFAAHRSGHVRTSALGNRLIVAGANAGQFHAFKTSDLTEAWSFVPPNLLTKLKNISHATHNATAPLTSLTHNYYVDGPVTVADVWLGDGDGTSKSADWKTLLVFAEGRGAVNYAWSSSSSCDSGINSLYTTTYKYYCGYHALNLNDPLNPAYMWHIDFADDTDRAAKAPYLGDPWSKMMTGRVRIKVSSVWKEKWVGFIGAGYNGADCSGGGTCDTRGKGIFVIDLSNGQVLWSYTKADNSNMKYSMAASPAIVDTDNDGFIDTAYVGDLGGNMWRFKFCRSTDTTCGTTNWSGGLFYASSSGNIRPIYTMAGVAKDNSSNLWVYWGTGDKTDPTASNAQERFFGVKDNLTSSYGFNDLDNITSTSQVFNPASTTDVGYALNLAGSGQKILADPTIFGGVVYFTSYNPPSGSDPCEQGGIASLHALIATTGAGALTDGARSMEIGSGIPTSPIISLPPGSSGSPDLYVTTSGGGGTAASTQRIDMTPAGVANRTNMLYWKDLRIQ